MNNKALDRKYGSLEDNIADGNVWITKYEDGISANWEPGHWGCDRFYTKEELDRFASKSQNGVLIAAVAQSNDGYDLLGIVQYDISELVNLEDFVSPPALNSLSKKERNKWKYCIREVRRWEFKGVTSATLREKLSKYSDALEDNDVVKAVDVNWLSELDLLLYDGPFHYLRRDLDDPFIYNPSVYIKAAYGFHPPSWGCVGWNEPGRAQTLIGKTTDPFIMANWVTFSSGDQFAGKLAGFYEITHETGLRTDFTADYHDDQFDEKFWKYSLRASRAWEILPEYQPNIMDFYPEMYEAKQERSTGRWGAELPLHVIEKLKSLPRREVEVYGRDREIVSDIAFPSQSNGKGFVSGGASRKSGYEVGEPKNTEKELYLLKLSGDTSSFKREGDTSQTIYKVGLSLSPQTRCNCLNSALPGEKCFWEVVRSTRKDGHKLYPNFEIAEAGEMAMKQYLGVKPGNPDNHLGGEFYSATDDMIGAAWKIGRAAALAKAKEYSDG